MNLHHNKFIFRSIFVALLSFICMEIGLPESISSKTALAQNISADPLCYWQTANGASIDLGALCTSKSNQNIPAVSLTNTQDLTIDSIKFIKVKPLEPDFKFKIVGTIRNTGNISQRYIEVSYQGYRKTEGLLKVRESHKVFADDVILQPGETTTFTVELKNHSDLLLINSLDSVEEGSIPLNICYANSVEKKELCQRLSPSVIKSFG